MKTAIIDNYDSFTYNLAYLVRRLTEAPVDIFKNDRITISQLEKYDRIILSPGPGIPDEAGLLKAIIKKYASTKKILGVCLGLQAIAEVFGGKLVNLKRVYHGIATEIIVRNEDEPLFSDLPKIIKGGRYHSWVIDRDTLPTCFRITAEDPKGRIMALSHSYYDLKGLQFHPESVLTEHGEKIIDNWLHQPILQSNKTEIKPGKN